VVVDELAILKFKTTFVTIYTIIVKLSFKYRVYLSAEQTVQLDKSFNFCRFLYNSALQERIDLYKKNKKSISYNSQSAQLPDIKELFEEQCKDIYSQSLQSTLKRVDSAYQNFFRRVKAKANKVGFPRYKSADTYNSISFPQCDLKSGGVKLKDNGKLKIYGITGDIEIKCHRQFKGKCKTVMLKKQADKYYIILSCDEVPLELLPKTGKTIGIDLGLNSFITTDDGTEFHHPKPYKTAKELLAYRNRKLATKQRGSKNRQKAKSLLAKAYEKITNIRQDFLHKTAKQLVVENDVIYIEDLDIKSMLETKGFNVKKSNIADASWGSFAAILAYKAERAGKLVVKIDPKNTSKMCSNCRNIKKDLALKDRVYHCVACGNKMNRDVNAAKNIKRLGLSLVANL